MSFGNPLLRKVSSQAFGSTADRATYTGVTTKLGITTLALLIAFFAVWRQYFTDPTFDVTGYAMGGSLLGFLMAMLIIFADVANAFTVPLYAVLEGVSLGAITAYLEHRYPGVALKSGLLTLAAFGSVLGLYTVRILQATPGFTKFILAALGAICITYIADLVLGFFGMHIPLLNSNSWAGIGISVGIVVVASLSLVLDFGRVEDAVTNGADQSVEWRLSFGLMVSLVWLYVEILRLMTKLSSKD